MIFSPALDAIGGGAAETAVTGLWGSSKALFLWELAQSAGRPLLVLSPTPKESQALQKDFSFFSAWFSGSGTWRAPGFFPPWDVLPYDVMPPDPAIVAERLKVLKETASGETAAVFAPVNSFLQRLPSPGSLVSEQATLTLKAGLEQGHDTLVAKLIKLGYRRTAAVYEPGEFSVRGGILDIFTPGSAAPVRAEFFGDTVESMRAFDPDTQRSTNELDEVIILPASESAEGREELSASLRDYFKERPIVIFDEPGRIASQARELLNKAFSLFEEGGDGEKKRPEELYLTEEELERIGEGGQRVTVESLPVEAPGGQAFHFSTRSIEGLRLREVAPEPWPESIPKTPISIFCQNLKALTRGRAVNVAAQTKGQAERLREIFAEYGVPAEEGRPALMADYLLPSPPAGGVPACGSDGRRPGGGDKAAVVRIAVGSLSSGFLMDAPGLAFITATEIFGEKPRHAPAPKARAERFLTSLSELKPGDYVVHVDHGIGRYMGMKRLSLLGVEQDFLDVIYNGRDRLYVPVNELDKVQKYIGSEGAAPALDKLGGVAWERAKARAKKAVAEMARELLELYAARSVAPGFAYSPDDHLYREMEAAFEYEETPDQARAIMDVKEDLEKPHPMDRLVCGDVGYGKTEVAIRAAFKAALDGKQAAVLVPTTLLADQHFRTFGSRLAPFPVTVEMLSRFTPRNRMKELIKGIGTGAVDIVIGTHRLLQKDVSFHDLGLLIIDEEHRFGVAHKEKLKQLKKQVDVLTLTATPIPRTLNMSITGIRDLSVIETPPPDRQPIKTVVTRFDRTAIRDAIMREIGRGGQVFFVHNRIESIFAIGDLLMRTVPEARIGVAHGRMNESALEDVMTKFVAGEYDILLTTSIIESGLDIPNANTIIIDRADRFGLADLYQLRGRVGRSQARGYAYLLVPGEDSLTETAQKRLRVLSELTEMGAGFKLALHDLEIRGAGNILGSEQSGHIAAVGFELYTHMLEQAVRELRGEEVEEGVDPAIDLKVSAFIPESYVQETSGRLGIYKRLSGARSEEEVADIQNELADRYGPLPEEAVRLMQVMELKVLARRLKAAGIQLMPSEIKITFTEKVDIQPEKLVAYLAKNRGRARYVPEYNLFIKKPAGGWEELFAVIKNCLKELL